MTEHEAKTKWCPFTQQRTAIKHKDNDKIMRRLAPRCRCLASGCMAWRSISPLDEDSGYCGLAEGPRYVPRLGDDDN